MKQITVISGKGGTGKTTITACLAKLAPRSIIADCDVDAADLHLLLKPAQTRGIDFYSGKEFTINHPGCTKCGKCKELCRFDAIADDFTIDGIACDGCGACYYACPDKAISIQDKLVGEYYISSIKGGSTPFVHANLYVAQDNSGKLVSRLRSESYQLAEQSHADYIIVDGPPGIGCPVNAAIVDIDLALIVTEPSISGIHDLMRILDLCRHFNLHVKVVINKYDINQKNTDRIEGICRERNIPCIAKIPYDVEMVKALMTGNVILDTNPEHIISQEIKKIWQNIK